MCADDTSIKSSEECEAAAEALDLFFWGEFNLKGDFPDCFRDSDNYGLVFFNAASDTSTDGYPEEYDVRPICREGKTGTVLLLKSFHMQRSLLLITALLVKAH